MCLCDSMPTWTIRGNECNIRLLFSLAIQISANVISKQTEQISETDVAGELQSSKAQIRRLAKAQAESEERVRSVRMYFCGSIHSKFVPVVLRRYLTGVHFAAKI